MVSGGGGLLASSGVWTKLEAAHVFPLECESLWNEFGFSRWVTNMDETMGISKINSVQNGLLMKRDLHSAFDQYFFSINPDDGYKIVSFAPDEDGIDGRVLEPACRDPANPDRVSDEILCWHFRQSVLATMRGNGEPIFEMDFPRALIKSKHCPTNRIARNVSRWRWTCACNTLLEMKRFDLSCVR